ncbi:MAG: rhodanese-like domain-containing protein [Actinomycetota bacterium]
MHPIPTVTVDQIPADALLLDVREDEEWSAGHIAGALHVPMYDLPDLLAIGSGGLTPQAPVYVICKVGARSAQVTAWLNKQGYDARNVHGGMLAWHDARRPMASDNGAPPQVI